MPVVSELLKELESNLLAFGAGLAFVFLPAAAARFWRRFRVAIWLAALAAGALGVAAVSALLPPDVWPVPGLAAGGIVGAGLAWVVVPHRRRRSRRHSAENAATRKPAGRQA